MQDEEGFSGFLTLCLAAKDKQALNNLFDLFLSPEEKNDIAMRYLIVNELLAGKKTQRAIAKDLNVSIAKITRGSNSLKQISPELLKFVTTKIQNSD